MLFNGLSDGTGIHYRWNCDLLTLNVRNDFAKTKHKASEQKQVYKSCTDGAEQNWLFFLKEQDLVYSYLSR